MESAETVSQSNVFHVCVGAPNNKGNCHVCFSPFVKKAGEKNNFVSVWRGGAKK